MKTRIVHTAYRTQYHDPIVIKTGDWLRLGPEETDEKWKGWIWAETLSHKGWVPMQVLEIAADRLSAQVLQDYTAQELDVDAGDEVEILQEQNGWSFCRHLRGGKEGWVPDEVLT